MTIPANGQFFNHLELFTYLRRIYVPTLLGWTAQKEHAAARDTPQLTAKSITNSGGFTYAALSVLRCLSDSQRATR
jgi:hypothetical protein